MKHHAKKVLFTLIRWSIAVAGIWLVLHYMSLRDRVLVILNDNNIPRWATLAAPATDDSLQYKIIDPANGQTITVDRDQVINPASAAASNKAPRLQVRFDGQEQTTQLLGMRLKGDINHNPRVEQLLVKAPSGDRGVWIPPSQVIGGYRLDVPRPRVEVGVISMVAKAKPRWPFLVLAVVIFPITFIITSYRWDKLMQALEIRMTAWRAFVINMVGAFYNAFMLGSTGGDVLKAYYAAKQTMYRTRAVMSVLVDRILGLLALILLGGVMASYQAISSPSASDPAARACRQVAIGSVLLLAALGLGLAILFQPAVRHWLGLEFILKRLPMQRQVEGAREVTRIYRQRPWLVIWALLITLPVHITVVISAMLAGQAFDLPIRPLYYFTAVPVIVLVGSVPISPQGAGVMEFFAIMLTQRQGATVSEAFALTMSIRVVQVLWNLTGGIFVLKGGFHAPSQSEQQELEGVATVA